MCHTLDLAGVGLLVAHVERSGLAVQGIRRVGVGEQLREEALEDVEHLVHGRPCLVDHV